MYREFGRQIFAYRTHFDMYLSYGWGSPGET